MRARRLPPVPHGARDDGGLSGAGRREARPPPRARRRRPRRLPRRAGRPRAAALAPASIAYPPPDPLALALDAPAFWDGPARVHASARDSLNRRAPCAPSEDGPCCEFRILVPEGAARLRVAVDEPAWEDWYSIELIAPSGDSLRDGNVAFSAESLVDRPAAGEWAARVVAERVTESTFHMRALAESSIPLPPPDGPLLPNLRAEPPFSFTFEPPLAYDHSPEPWHAVNSCTWDETLEEGARRCLRFSFVYGNWGDGPMDLRFSPLTDAASEATVRQRVHHANGSWADHDAGSYTYHKTHAHYHYDDVFAATLYRVLDASTGEVEPVGPAAKRGACAHDWKLVDWHAFYQAPQGADDSGRDCDYSPGRSPVENMRIGLSRGWADVYGWNLPSNYVEFSGEPDGCYLVVAVADPNARLLETREDDNEAFALVTVAGDAVRLVSRGHGPSPWHATSEVVERSGEACA